MNALGGGSYAFETIGSTYRLVFPYRKEWLRIVSSGLVLAVLPYLLFFGNLGPLFDTGFTPVNLTTLVIFGVLVVVAGLMVLELLWQLAGKEVVEVSDDAVVMAHQILGIGLSQKIPADKIGGIFVSQQNSWAGVGGMRRDYRFFNFSRGWVALTSGKSLLGRPVTYRFGTSLDAGEAGDVVTLILSRFPQYKMESRPAD